MGNGGVDHVALRRAMAAYAAALVAGDYDVAEVLYQLSDECVGVLGLAGAGVSLRNADGELEFVTATDGRASRMESAQVRIGDGPCFHAFRTGCVVAVPDLHEDDRWPDHGEIARAVGYRGVAGVPMPVGRAPIGALNLYDSEGRCWTADELDVAALLANMAAGYVLMARSLADSRTLTQQLQHALDSRVVVEQAKGMLAAQLTVDVNEAFERLRRHARRNRLRVRDVAREVVEGRLSLGTEGATTVSDPSG